MSESQYKRTTELRSFDIELAADTDPKGFRHENAKKSLLQPSRKVCPVVCRDDDPWDAAGGLGREAPSPPGTDDTEEPSASSRHLRSARGNGLDLRPATAAGVSSSHTLSSMSQDANSTRQTDLGSLSAQLFAPRPQVHGGNLRCCSCLKCTSC